ncbi:MAG: RNA-binding protein [Chloroherpetonaceae bacterium]|nr:RNA-binding protein [Chloroherpetonaceae bacterium]MCS7210684.1 RNA-binding protein [Chloroherpetonaceae bacterium]MDW8020846.1 RNA-binding protein [Chloroherpetonaceae bacterium]MDW8464967.1 RNA-binding protein [Chloroherpetonaceae bacterium]
MATKLYVGNLNYATSEEGLRNVFANFGEIVSVKIIQGKGFGFVEYKSADDAEAAKEALNNTQLDGRSIKVSDARPQEKKSFGERGGLGGERRFGGSKGSSGYQRRERY